MRRTFCCAGVMPKALAMDCLMTREACRNMSGLAGVVVVVLVVVLVVALVVVVVVVVLSGGIGSAGQSEELRSARPNLRAIAASRDNRVAADVCAVRKFPYRGAMVCC